MSPKKIDWGKPMDEIRKDLDKLGIELDKKPVTPQKNRVFYRCEKTTSYGLTVDNVIVTGLALVPYFTVEHDFVEDQINDIGAEGVIHLPEDLAEGVIYEASITDISRDWESGHIVDWSIAFTAVTDPEQLAEIEAMKTEYEQMEATYGDHETDMVRVSTSQDASYKLS